MRTITVAASKGGVHKSSIVMSCAVMASKTARVAMLDWEPQGSLSFWYAARGCPDNPKLLKGDPLDIVEGDTAKKFDWLFIDTAPSGLDEIERSIVAAGAVLIPVHASTLDIAAIRSVAAICKNLDKPYAIVLTGVEENRKIVTRNSRKLLSEFGDVLAVEITHNSKVYADAINNKGRTGPEHPDGGFAKKEIAELLKAAKALADKSKRGRT